MITNPNTLSRLEFARLYQNIGIALIPIVPGTKRPPKGFRQTQYRTVKPTKKTLEGWFDEEGHDIAILMGKPSGYIAIRDFDDIDVFHEWEAKYPSLANELPIAATPRTGGGRHVMFRYDPNELPDELRGKAWYTYPDGSGELRLEDCYCVTAPSKHKAGGTYQWINLPANIPTLSLEATGFITGIVQHTDGAVRTNATEICTHATLNTHAVYVHNNAQDNTPYNAQDNKSHRTLSDKESKSENSENDAELLTHLTDVAEEYERLRDYESVRLRESDVIVAKRFSKKKNSNAQDSTNPISNSADVQNPIRNYIDITQPLQVEHRELIETAIHESQPQREGERERKVFELCRGLKAIPGIRDCPSEALENIAREWHKRALPIIGTKPFKDTLQDFINGYEDVLFPKGENSLRELFKRAHKADIPQEAKILRFRSLPEIQRLAALCRVMQIARGNKPFWISGGDAAEFLGEDPVKGASTSWKRLISLQKAGIITVTELGGKDRATRYRYKGLLPDSQQQIS